MILYENTVSNFLQSQRTRKLGKFFADEYAARFGHPLPPERLLRWKYSLESLRALLTLNEVSLDCGIRIDHMVSGGAEELLVILASMDAKGAQAVLLGMAPWQKAELTDMEDIIVCATEDGEERYCVHPSFQSASTLRYLLKSHSGKNERIRVQACSYFYDCSRNAETDISVGYHPELVEKAPLFYAGEEEALTELLAPVTGCGGGREALQVLYRCSQTANLERAREGEEKNAFLGDHKLVYAEIMKRIRSNSRAWFLVEGGSGTGKSLVSDSIRGDLEKTKKSCAVISDRNTALPEKHVDVLIIEKKGTFSEEAASRADVVICFYDEKKLVDVEIPSRVEKSAEKLQIPLYRYTLGQNMGFADDGKGINWLIRHLQLANVSHKQWDPAAYSIEVVDSLEGLKPKNGIAVVKIRSNLRYDPETQTVKGSPLAKAKVYELLSNGKKGVILYCEDAELQAYLKRSLTASRSKYDWLRLFESTYNQDAEKLADAQREIMENNLVRMKFERQAIGYLTEASWKKMSELSRTCLVSSLLAFHDMKEFNQLLDFSGVCVQVCKAVENELVQRFFLSYVDYLTKKYGSRMTEKAPNIILAEDENGRKVIRDVTQITLGTIPYIVGLDENGAVKSNFAWQQFREYAAEALFPERCNLIPVLTSQLLIMKKIRVDYRNKAAHKTGVDIVTAKDCLDYVVIVYRKLGELLDAYRF